MNIKNIVRSAKCGGITRAKRALRSKVATGVLGALVAVGLSAFAAEPSVTVGKVKSGEPWSKITVNYTLGGTDAKTDYKVAFDITAGGQTASVTNDAAKVENKGYSQEIDTAALFGAATPDTKAKVKVSLIALKPKACVQLWEGGPYFATCNIGADTPEGYGILTNYNDAAQVVTDALGEGWRLPTKDELGKLANASYCTKKWDSVNKGYTFTGATEGYKDKSIFLPAAGYVDGGGREDAGIRGYCWSSTERNATYAYALYFHVDGAGVSDRDRGNGLSVRAVRGSAE